MSTDIRIYHEHAGRSILSWHRLTDNGHGDQTEAMNIYGGVLIRTTQEMREWVNNDFQIASMSSTAVTIEGLCVVQQWRVDVTADRISIYRVRMLSSSTMLTDDEHRIDMVVGSGPKARFRLFSADEDMPMPSDASIRFIAEAKTSKPMPEIDALRLDVQEARRELANIRYAMIGIGDPNVRLLFRVHGLLAERADRNEKLLALREQIRGGLLDGPGDMASVLDVRLSEVIIEPPMKAEPSSPEDDEDIPF
jgi:hypothetical protein